MTDVYTVQATIERRQTWLQELRGVCIVLSEKSPGLISSMSVTQRFGGVTAEERVEMLALGGHIAGEYGLVAEAVDRDASMTVRVSRPIAGERHDGANESSRRGLLARLVHLPGALHQVSDDDHSAVQEVPSGTLQASTREGTVRP